MCGDGGTVCGGTMCGDGGVVTSTAFLVRVYYSVTPLIVNQLPLSFNQPAFQVSGSTVFDAPSPFFLLNPHPQTPCPFFPSSH